MNALAFMTLKRFGLDKLNLDNDSDRLLKDILDLLCEFFKFLDLIGEESLLNFNLDFNGIKVVHTIDDDHVMRKCLTHFKKRSFDL